MPGHFERLVEFCRTNPIGVTDLDFGKTNPTTEDDLTQLAPRLCIFRGGFRIVFRTRLRRANAFSNQHGGAKLLPFSPSRKAVGAIKTDSSLGQHADKREVQISCAWLGWRRSELPRYLTGFQA